MPSFKELTAWVSLAVILFFYGSFFLHTADHVDADTTLRSLAGMVATLVVIEIILMIVLGIFSGREDQSTDERDRLIGAKAYRNAYFIVAAGITFAIFYSLVPDLSKAVDGLGLPPATILAHLLVLSLVAAEAVNFGSRIVYYRAGV